MERKKQKQIKIGTTVFLAPAQRAALAKLSAEMDVSIGHLIRQGVTLVLARYGKKGGR
jgi:hypothetical protein